MLSKRKDLHWKYRQVILNSVRDRNANVTIFLINVDLFRTVIHWLLKCWVMEITPLNVWTSFYRKLLNLASIREYLTVYFNCVAIGGCYICVQCAWVILVILLISRGGQLYNSLSSDRHIELNL